MDCGVERRPKRRLRSCLRLQPQCRGSDPGSQSAVGRRRDTLIDARLAVERPEHADRTFGAFRLSGPIGVRFNGARHCVYLHARPIADPKGKRRALVFFLEGESLEPSPSDMSQIEARAPDARAQQILQELQFTQAQLRASREEYEGANEELRAANEELQSINEEYRSTGEELETSKEELQSINEELQTVNSELKAKLDDVSRSHSDIQNLMDATDVGILFLDTDLRIKRFTPRIADIFNVAPGDEGRSITDFTHSLDYLNLAEDARCVLRDLVSSERELRGRNGGSWRLMRMRPYRTEDNRIDGVVVTLIDISELRRAEDSLRESEARIRAVIDGVTDAIVTFDERGIVQSRNAATTGIFGYSAEDLIGQDIGTFIPEARRVSRSKPDRANWLKENHRSERRG
jgi:two-component system CheB/CheR fusion protein